jgi:hypothetical protein
MESIRVLRSETSTEVDVIKESSRISKLVEASADEVDFEVEDLVVGMMKSKMK